LIRYSPGNAIAIALTSKDTTLIKPDKNINIAADKQEHMIWIDSGNQSFRHGNKNNCLNFD